MAQGSQRSKGSAKSRSSNARKSSGGTRSKPAASRRKQTQSRASSSRSQSASRRRTTANRSSNGKAQLGSVKQTIGDGARSARDSVTNGVQGTGEVVSTAARKAKGPALAGGAALAGLAGGMAIAARGGGPRRVLGVPVPGTRRPLVKIETPRRVKARGLGKDLVKAAGEVGSAGRQVGDLVTEVQRVRTELDRGRRRSPVEVVLEGLTSRRGRG